MMSEALDIVMKPRQSLEGSSSLLPRCEYSMLSAQTTYVNDVGGSLC